MASDPLPASFYRAEADYLTPPEDWGDPAFDGDECPVCGDAIGYGHDVCDEWADDRTCGNSNCPMFNTVWMDYEPGEPCEACGEPIGSSEK